MTYKQAFDKLTLAYIKNEVNPLMDCNCFVGNLLNNSYNWSDDRTFPKTLKNEDIGLNCRKANKTKFSTIGHIKEILRIEVESTYTPKEILLMERMFLTTFFENGGSNTYEPVINSTEEDEEALFIAFDKTLDFLKQIHIDKGENVMENILFTKRQLV